MIVNRKSRNLTIRSTDNSNLKEDCIPQEKNLVDFSKIRIGMKTIEDAILEIGNLRKSTDSEYYDKNMVLNAIHKKDIGTMRKISNIFFRISGIYSRLCRYMAYLYRYDWIVTPYVNSEAMNSKKLVKDFHKILGFLDNFEIKKFLGEVSLKIMKNGCYYGYYAKKDTEKVIIQELPPNYCRSRWEVNGKPLIEFNMKFFDDNFTITEQRMRILKLFPPEFKKGYILYKEGKLLGDYIGDTNGWYALDIEKTIKFNLNGEDYPPFIAVIPSLIDLDEGQDLDKKRMKQRLLKILIQKFPLDKNGDLIFDTDEIQELHNNAVMMLQKAMGVNILSTLADVEVADMSDNNTTTTVDDLNKLERGVFNEAGVSEMQFNTDGNIALEKSILNDEAFMYNLILQYESFLNELIQPFNTTKKMEYRIQILNTTIYNYKDLSKQYKELTSIGYSKMLPMIALGHTQSSILATAYFENDILDLVNVFLPPISSNNMNAETLQKNSEEDSKGGRPEKEDDEKSTKTIQNKESMN